jgi:hypothetical protein
MIKIKYFTLGALGSLISVISIGLIVIIDLFPSLVHLYLHPIYGEVTLFLTTILLGVGILLASFGYREIKNSYGLLSGTAGFAFGIIASIVVFSKAVVGIITPDVMLKVYPPPLIDQINSWMSLLNVLFLGFTQVIWGITHLKSRKFCKKPKLSLITSGSFIVSGAVMLSVILTIFYSYYIHIGLVLSFISLLFASIVFLNLSSNANQRLENKINEGLQKEG